jgi:hypothetical protein
MNNLSRSGSRSQGSMAKGWLRKKLVAVHCWRVTREGQRHVGWLLGERATRGQPEERKYDGSNLPATVEELAGYAQRRYAAEPCHEEAKGEVGWAHDQGRLGRASTGRRSRSCWPTALLSGWSCANGADREAEVALATRFPPRPDRRRQTLPAIHREVARWLRHQAVQWWVTTDRFIELCSRRF